MQDIVRKQGLFDVRLNEKDVSLFGGVPERLLVLMHEEMYQPALKLGMDGGLGWGVVLAFVGSGVGMGWGWGWLFYRFLGKGMEEMFRVGEAYDTIEDGSRQAFSWSMED